MANYIKSFSVVQSNTINKSGYIHICNTDDTSEIVHSFSVDDPVDRTTLLSAYERGETILDHIVTEGR